MATTPDVVAQWPILLIWVSGAGVAWGAVKGVIAWVKSNDADVEKRVRTDTDADIKVLRDEQAEMRKIIKRYREVFGVAIDAGNDAILAIQQGSTDTGVQHIRRGQKCLTDALTVLG
jgi:hypothetical protein